MSMLSQKTSKKDVPYNGHYEIKGTKIKKNQIPENSNFVAIPF
jgi:hypothetical protein